MRRLMFLLALLGVAAVTAGCDEKKTTAAGTTSASPAATKGSSTKTDW